MPFVRLETSIDLSRARRGEVMRGMIACASQALDVPVDACRAFYAVVDRADGVIGADSPEPWAMVYAHMKAGRSAGAKGAFTHALFDLLAEQLGVARSSLRILITDYAAEDWNNGGDSPKPR